MLVVNPLVLPPAKPFIQLDESKHVDFKENLFNALTLFKKSANLDLNPRPVDLLSAIVTAQPQHSICISLRSYIFT